MSQAGNSINIGGGGGSTTIFYNVTKTQLDNLIQNNVLSKGAMYKISGVHASNEIRPPLYYDGVIDGVTIILEAVSNNKLSVKGTGIFYNPIYDYNLPNASMWNPDGAYNIGDTVNYGGYVWINLNGSTGNSLNQITLNEEWEKIPYNDTNYVIAYDSIEYDYENDLITSRYEIQGNNEVTCTLFPYFISNMYGTNFYHPIALFKWGCPLNFFAVSGIGNIKVIDSVFECVNTPARLIYDINLNQNSHFTNVNMGENTHINNINITNFSYIQDVIINGNISHITLNNNSNINNVLIQNNVNIEQLHLNDGSYISNSTFTDGTYITYCKFFNYSYLNNLILESYSNINNCNFNGSAAITNSTLDNNSSIRYCNFNQNSYLNNTSFHFGAQMTGCIFNQDSHFTNIVMYDNSVFKYNTFDQGSYLDDCTINTNTVVEGCSIGANTIIREINFSTNTVFKNNKIGQSCLIEALVFNDICDFTNNIFDNNVTLRNCEMGSKVVIQGNIFESSSYVNGLTLGADIQLVSNTFGKQTLFGLMTLYNSIYYTTLETPVNFQGFDLSSATYIFEQKNKVVFFNSNNDVVLRYYLVDSVSVKSVTA